MVLGSTANSYGGVFVVNGQTNSAAAAETTRTTAAFVLGSNGGLTSGMARVNPDTILDLTGGKCTVGYSEAGYSQIGRLEGEGDANLLASPPRSWSARRAPTWLVAASTAAATSSSRAPAP